MPQSKERPVSGYLVLTLLTSCLIASIGAADGEKKSEEANNQKWILRDQVTDLKRLSSLKSHEAKQQDQTDQIALANHESIVLDGSTASLLPQILMMTSGSAPLPQGRRRLDESSGLLAMPANKLQLGLVPDMMQFGSSQVARSGALRQRQQVGGMGNQFDKIVDNGSSSQLDAGSIPHTAMMANINFNRMALASAKRLQRAQAGHQQQPNGRGRQRQHQNQHQLQNQNQNQHQHQQMHRRSLRQSPMRSQRNQMSSSSSRPQESKVNNKRMRGKASKPLNEFDDNEERDEISSRSDRGDYDDDDESGASEQDDERPSSESRSSRRQSDDDIFNELDDDKSGADEGADEDSPAPRAKSASEQQRRLKKAATRKQARALQQQPHQARGPKRGGQGEDQQDIDEDIDSTNARQTTIRRRADGGNQKSRQQQQHKRQSLQGSAMNTPEVATEVEGDATIAGELSDNYNSNSGAQQIDGKPDGDDLSAASYVRNTAADLQTAAGKHYGGHHYHQMIEVPKKKAYKMSFKRGNHKHEIMKKEKLHKHKFHTKFAWHAKEKCKKKKKCKSVGKMTWEYKHDKKHHH